jgi:hypothetical protein
MIFLRGRRSLDERLEAWTGIVDPGLHVLRWSLQTGHSRVT